jgi:hypothetical protein
MSDRENILKQLKKLVEELNCTLKVRFFVFNFWD